MKQLIPLCMLMLLNVLFLKAQENCILAPTFTIEKISDNCDFEIDLCIDVTTSSTQAIEFYLAYEDNGTTVTDMLMMASSTPFSTGQHCQNFTVMGVPCNAEFTGHMRSYTHISCGEDNLCGKSEDITFTNVVAPLPLDLVSFEAKKKNGYTNLEWITVANEKTERYILQRSKDGLEDFENIHEIDVEEKLGNAYYTFKDRDLVPIAYYRILAIDLDGSEVYSPIVVMDRKNDFLREVNVFPIPASTELNIVFDAIDENVIRISITNLYGVVLVEQKISKTKGRHLQKLDLSALKSNSIYIVNIDNGVERTSQKFIKG